MGCKSFHVVRFDLGALLLIIGPRGLQCSFYYAFPRLLSLYWGEKTRTRYDPESR